MMIFSGFARSTSLMFLAGISFASPLMAAERGLELGYNVYLGGLNIFSFDVNYDIEGGRYVITGGGKTKGAVRLVWKWAVKATARGILQGQNVGAQSYDVHTKRRSKDKLMRLAFIGDGDYVIDRTPLDTPFRRQKRDLPKSLPIGAIDPVSATLKVAAALAGGGTCGGKIPIFDGNRRFDLVFRKLGDELLAKPGFSAFRGTAMRCQFSMKRISGFRKQRIMLSFWDGENLEPPEVWLARLNNRLPPVPVKFQADFNLGYMIIYLDKASYRGRSLLAALSPKTAK